MGLNGKERLKKPNSTQTIILLTSILNEKSNALKEKQFFLFVLYCNKSNEYSSEKDLTHFKPL